MTLQGALANAGAGDRSRTHILEAVRQLPSSVAAVGALAVIATGCAADHTVGHVRLLNDTKHRVLLARCKDEACKSLSDRSTVLPDRGGTVATSVVGVPNPFIVSDTDGRTLGCLPLVLPHYVEGLVARVSAAIPCKHSYDEHQQWPPN